jgi:DNA-binding HxlR family transcriptional regulator
MVLTFRLELLRKRLKKMKEKGIPVMDCPVKKALEIVGGKWKLQIINQVGNDVRRYGELKRLLPDISEKMLIQELKSLVEYGILEKRSYHEIPPRVEYFLTKKGKKVLPLIEAIKAFGVEMQDV